eukprot:CAMPEP_0176022776 /NCGR_PEP_ID=MMETSP0120_2-20121206/11095_1 /TAXON_ID=160619 /ORGANISM="Kryptoperidinium foliaceum, Strain CCMP 1326" /LENGTH=241 /DNA_ID=CAMNT_0017355923 /DNA_START=184 /DNA_END=906 /DNA_ORIENTATION=+
MDLLEDRHDRLQRPLGHTLSSAIVSGDSDQNEESSAGGDTYFGDSADIFEDAGEYSMMATGEEQGLFRYDRNNPAHQDELYDQNLDDEDEAYVYKHMRGGTEKIRRGRGPHGPPEDGGGHGDVVSDAGLPAVPKPRNSDAVLSCPCCFNIVCMDCQRHQKYLNQFRAMFVMGIMVDWQSRLVYDEDQQYLVPKPEHLPNQVPTEELSDIGERKDCGIAYTEGEYFPVLCGNCRTPAPGRGR